MDRMFQFQRLGWNDRADRRSGGITDSESHISSVVAFWGIRKKVLESCQMSWCNKRSSRKLGQQCINGSHMECRYKLLQFREQDADQSGNGSLQPGTFLNFVETVSCKRLQLFVMVWCVRVGLEWPIGKQHHSNRSSIDFIRFRLSKALTFSVKICM